jgi:hypothetical protein
MQSVETTKDNRIIALLLVAALGCSFTLCDIRRAEAQDCGAMLNELINGSIQPGVGSQERALEIQNLYNQNCLGHVPAYIPPQYAPQGNKYMQPQAPAQTDQTDDAKLRAAQEKAAAKLYKQLRAAERAYRSLEGGQPLSHSITSHNLEPPAGYTDKFANQNVGISTVPAPPPTVVQASPTVRQVSPAPSPAQPYTPPGQFWCYGAGGGAKWSCYIGQTCAPYGGGCMGQ